MSLLIYCGKELAGGGESSASVLKCEISLLNTEHYSRPEKESGRGEVNIFQILSSALRLKACRGKF